MRPRPQSCLWPPVFTPSGLNRLRPARGTEARALKNVVSATHARSFCAPFRRPYAPHARREAATDARDNKGVAHGFRANNSQYSTLPSVGSIEGIASRRKSRSAGGARRGLLSAASSGSASLRRGVGGLVVLSSTFPPRVLELSRVSTTTRPHHAIDAKEDTAAHSVRGPRADNATKPQSPATSAQATLTHAPQSPPAPRAAACVSAARSMMRGRLRTFFFGARRSIKATAAEIIATTVATRTRYV